MFNGVPLLIDHAPVSAADPKQQLIAGTVSDCVWRDERVMGTVNVWTSEGIEGIETRCAKT